MPQAWLAYLQKNKKSYFRVIVWKLKILVKMTFGYWDTMVLETQEIKHRSERFDLNTLDPFEKHESAISSVGVSNSLVWLFLPMFSVVSKMGEACNSSPVFVYDRTVDSAIAEATKEHKNYLEDQKGSKEEGSDEGSSREKGSPTLDWRLLWRAAT